jgi:adenylate cyclase
MKARTIYLVTLLATSGTGFGQSALPKAEHDSLWAVWIDPAQADMDRLDAIERIAWDGYMFSEPDSANYYAQLQFELATAKGVKKRMGSALRTQGMVAIQKGDKLGALEYLQRSLKIGEESGDKEGIAASLTNIGYVHSEQGDHGKALDHYRRSLGISTEIGDGKGMAKAVNNIGLIHFEQGNFPEALVYFRRSMNLFEDIGDMRSYGGSLNNIGIIYSKQKQYPKALEHYEQCLKIQEESGSKKGIALSLLNIGLTHMHQGDFAKALDHTQRSREIYEEIGDRTGISRSLISLGLIYTTLSDHPNALLSLQRSLHIAEEIGDKLLMVTCLNALGELDNEQGRYKEAVAWCERSLVLAEELEAPVEQKDACRCLYDAHKALGRGNAALVYLEKSGELDKQLNKEETTRKLQQMEFEKVMLQDSLARVEEARLVQEAHREEVLNSTRTRNVLAVSGSFLLLLAGGFYSRARYMRRSRAVLQVEKDRSENLLLNILPAEVAEELKTKGRADARDFELVSIMFTDFKGFTEASARLSAADLVTEINTCFEAFDGIIGKYGVEKIKTIGDAYMAAGGLPVPSEGSVKNTVLAALEMQAFITGRKAERDAQGQPAFAMRVGIHTGPVVAGIVGVKKFQYDIWGDTVNTASRMESSGEVGRVNISEATYELLKDDPAFQFSPRGKVQAKGKGEVEMWFVEGAGELIVS